MEKRRRTHAGTKGKATTAEVVGGLNQKNDQIPAKWRKYYARLLDLRDQFLRRQTNLTKDAIEEQPSFSSHIADAGTDTYDRDLALGMLSSEQEAVYEIEEAMDRIRNGSYGRCELTGKPIEPDRLEAIPWTRFGAEAEKELEREGATKRARLGARESVAKGETRAEAGEHEHQEDPEEA